jgi:hypothetical protein
MLEDFIANGDFRRAMTKDARYRKMGDYAPDSI